jgi:hypothetical protein
LTAGRKYAKRTVTNLSILQIGNNDLKTYEYMLHLAGESFLLHLIINAYCGELFITDFISFVLSRYKTILIAANQLPLRGKTEFENRHKSSKFLLEIKILVSSNSLCLNKVYFEEFRRLGCGAV